MGYRVRLPPGLGLWPFRRAYVRPLTVVARWMKHEIREPNLDQPWLWRWH